MTAKVRFTRRDLELWPDDGKRRELIDGDIYVAPAPSLFHQRLVVRLVCAVGQYLEARPLGEILIGPLDVLLPGEDTVQPDLIYVSRERATIVTERGIEGVPDWVIEVTSAQDRDYNLETKRLLYREVGVPMYWVVDPETDMIYVSDGGRFTAYSESDLAVVSALPDFALSLEELFGSR